MDTLKKIIETYLHNPMSEDVQHLFARWLTNGDRLSEKDGALYEQWNEISVTAKDSLTPTQRLTRLKELHRIIGKPRSKRGIFISRTTVAFFVSVFLVLLSIPTVLLVTREESQTCLVAPSNGKGEFVLPDGTHIWLNSDSRVEYYDDFGRDSRKVSLKGEAYFDVSKSNIPFVVVMDEINVQVLGTSFNARNSELYDVYEVTLKEGKVRVFNDEIGEKELLPSQQFRVSRSLDNPEVRSVDPFNSSCWTSSSVDLSDKSLKDVIACLEHWYNVRIVTELGVNLDERISLKIKTESLVETMDVIKALVHHDYRIVDERRIIILN